MRGDSVAPHVERPSSSRGGPISTLSLWTSAQPPNLHKADAASTSDICFTQLQVQLYRNGEVHEPLRLPPKMKT